MQSKSLILVYCNVAVSVEFTKSQLVTAIPGTFFCIWYALRKHWLANNVLGVAFCIQVPISFLSSWDTNMVLLSDCFSGSVFL